MTHHPPPHLPPALPSPFPLSFASPRQSPFVMQSGAEGPQPQPQLLPSLPPGWGDTREGGLLPFIPTRRGLAVRPACAWETPGWATGVGWNRRGAAQ